MSLALVTTECLNSRGCISLTLYDPAITNTTATTMPNAIKYFYVRFNSNSPSNNALWGHQIKVLYFYGGKLDLTPLSNVLNSAASRGYITFNCI